MRDIWITENQVKHEEALLKAIRENVTVAILDHPGTGFKFSVARVTQLMGGIKTVAVQIKMRPKQREIGIEMLTKLQTIRFNNMKSASVSVFDLLRVVGMKVRQDFKGRKIPAMQLNLFSDNRLRI